VIEVTHDLPNLKTAARLLGGELNGDQILAPGPGHSATDRSLSVRIDANAPDGFVLHSFAGDGAIVCRDHVREKLSLPAFKPNGNDKRHRASNDAIERALQAVVAKQAPHKEKPKRVVATYNYKDADGTLLYQQLRYEPKRFAQRRPNGNGGWIWNLNDVRRVLYRWPELIAYPDATVFVCEGEKDTDIVCVLDLTATTVASGKWTQDCIDALAGRDCWIIQDVDINGVGDKKARNTASHLHGVAKNIKIVRLPGLTGDPGNKDVSDWLEQGHSKDELIEVCASTPDWEPGDTSSDSEKSANSTQGDHKQQSKTTSLCYFSDIVEAKRKPWLIKNVIARGETSGWIAPPGKGKSALLTDIFIHGAAGLNWRGYRTKGQFGGLYFALERVDLVKRRFVAHRLRDKLPTDLPIAIYGQVIDLMSRGCVNIVLNSIKQAEDRLGFGIGLVGFDTYAKGIAAGGGDESDAKDQNVVLANLRRVLDKADIHIATIGHTGKDESRGERGSNAKLADHDLQVQITGDTIRSAIAKKANDQPEGLLTSFRLEPYDFGPDEDGDPFRTYILSKQIIEAAVTPKRMLNPKQQLAMEALAEVTLSHGVNIPAVNGLPAGLKSVTADQWRNELFGRKVLDPDVKNPRARYAELRNQLAARHLIGVRDELVWLAKTNGETQK